MATNQYFRNNGSSAETNEQRLIEDLMVESTQIYGEDIYYIKRESQDSIDLVFGEDPLSKYEDVYQMEMFVINAETWENGEDFFSKFGLQVNESTKVAVPKIIFERYVTDDELTRPREGDLIWIPVMQHLFIIKFVEHENPYFQLGRRVPMLYEMSLEKYVFSQEEFDTGIDEIDDIEVENSYVIRMTLDANGTGEYTFNEVVYQGANLAAATATAEVTNWFPANNTIDIRDIKGTFTTTSNIIGTLSGTDMTITSYNDLEDHVTHQDFFNDDIEESANVVIDVSENNPFGMP